MNRILLTLVSVALLGAPVLAQMNHGGHGASSKTETGMSDMATLDKLGGKAFDRAYLSMMIAHHQGAVDMSKAVTARVKNAQVKTWVNAVITDQTKEINTMTTWLRGMGGVQTNMRDAMARDMKGMIAGLKTARNADVAFVQGMIPHHASALDMANLAMQKSTDDRVLKLSRDIIRAQADEMYAFKTWLAKNAD